MIDKLLKERILPPLKDRMQMLDILQKEEYGYLPDKPVKLTWTEEHDHIHNFCAGKADAVKVTLNAELANGNKFSFPIYAAIPAKKGKYPFFVHINFRDNVPDMYMPTEEIIDNGFAVVSFCYKDVTSDDSDFTNGLAGALYKNGERGMHDAGKIAIWAWAASRALDWAYSVEALDKNRAIVCGHSRLGKTALLCGAADERFACAYSNDSGCSGAAVARGNTGESIKVITDVFPFWFCNEYKKYADAAERMPFDQHYLIACMAPRFVCVGSAKEDEWADPLSEQLGCAAAGEAYEKYNLPGFICPNRAAETGEAFFDGSIGYHKRAGTHYFSREDWKRIMEFVNIHCK